jgi:hypothetical protein
MNVHSIPLSNIRICNHSDLYMHVHLVPEAAKTFPVPVLSYLPNVTSKAHIEAMCEV